MPPLPPFDGAHPLVVHFPIALLATVPVFLVLGLLVPARREQFATAALILLVLGTLGAILAVRTGEASEENAKRVPAAHDTFERHEELGERTRLIFILLTGAFAALVAGRRKLAPRLAPIIHLAYLLAYCAGLVVLANTAHQGGLLVHHFGVRAPVAGAPVGDLAPATPDDDDHDNDDD